jgi:hypothetical protein
MLVGSARCSAAPTRPTEACRAHHTADGHQLILAPAAGEMAILHVREAQFSTPLANRGHPMLLPIDR